MINNVKRVIFLVFSVLFIKSGYCMELPFEENLHKLQVIENAMRKLEQYAGDFTPKSEEFDNVGDFVLALLKGARDNDAMGVRSVLVRARHVGWWAPYVEVHEHNGAIKIAIRDAFKKIMLFPSQADLASFYSDSTMLPDQIKSFFDFRAEPAVLWSKNLALQRRSIVGCPIIIQIVRGVLYSVITIDIAVPGIPDRDLDVVVEMTD